MSGEPSRPDYKRIAAQLKKRAVRNLRHTHRDPKTYRNLFAEIQSSAKGAQRSLHDPWREWYYATNISGNSYILASYLEPWIGAEQATALYESVEPIHARCQHLSDLLSKCSSELEPYVLPRSLKGRLRESLYRFVSGSGFLVTLPLRFLSMLRCSSRVTARSIPPPRPPASS